MKLDERIIDRARKTDVIAFLEGQGFTFTSVGGAFRCREHKSLAVKSDRLSWYWHSRGVGGYGALDFLIKAENIPFRDAVSAILGCADAPSPLSKPIAQEPSKMLVLPEKRAVPLRLYDYLCRKRGIHGSIVNELLQKGTLYEDVRGNVVFVGCDENGATRFASLRGTHGDCTFRMDCAGSDKRYGFNMEAHSPSERLYIFESPIDAMSHASLENAGTGDSAAWKRHSRLSLAGTSEAALPFFLNQHTTVRELAFCLDNDAPGRAAAATLARNYAEKGYTVRIALPAGKDFNEDLQAHTSRIRADKRVAFPVSDRGPQLTK